MSIKKLFILINILILTFLLSSCTGSRELHEMGIVLATGLDIEGGKVIITNEIVKPSDKSEGSNGNQVVYTQAEGDTVLEAFRNTTLSFDRKLFHSHNTVIIFGEEFAKRGIGDYMDLYKTDSEPRETLYLLVAKGAKAYEVLGINAGLSEAPGIYLTSLIENYKHTSKTRALTMFEYYRYFYDRKTPLLGVVQKKEVMEINKETNNGVEERLILDVTGGAPFYKDKLIGYYTGDEMLGFNFIVDQIEGGLITFEVNDEAINLSKAAAVGTLGKYSVMEILESKTKNEIEIIEGNINLTINVTLRGVLAEEHKGLEITELEVKDALEKACSNKIKEYIVMTMDKAQKELKNDNFGINALFHRKYPEEWRQISNDWRSVFPDINYTVNAETKIVRTGLTNTPSNIKKVKD